MGVAYKQTVAPNQVSGTSISASVTPSAANDLLIVSAVGILNSSLSIAATGYTFHLIGSQQNNTGFGGEVAYWWALTINTSTVTITVSMTTSSSMGIQVDEYSGTDLNTPINAFTIGNHNATNNPSVSLTPTVDNCMLYGGLEDDFSTTPTVGSGFTIGALDNGNCGTEHKLLGTGTGGVAQTVNWGNTNGADWVLLAAAIQPPSSFTWLDMTGEANQANPRERFDIVPSDIKREQH